ncbi:MAG: type II secretion system protein GspE [Planctomyces sp.]|nr:type II secretion system protein GspE [Planctomyces sp.]MBA4039637.1 type II secretion system protein GspE [Planctomyces sp.]MBA4119975.1 type II secretion system protein GspE [Isosphaera sp.]
MTTLPGQPTAQPRPDMRAQANGSSNGHPAHAEPGPAQQPPAPAPASNAAIAELSEKPPVNGDAARLLTSEQAARLRAVPFGFDGRRLLVAMADPADLDSADEVSVIAGRPVRRCRLSQPDHFDQLLRSAYGATASQMAQRLGGQESEQDELLANLQAVDAADVHRMAQEPSVVNLVNLIILEAVRGRASDVHVEPFERALTVKYRIDGELRPQNSPPKALQAAITSRIKIMCGMDIAERYVPQDGHITLRFEGRRVDIRVSTVPTIYGESVVMRILDKQAVTLDLAALGMRPEHRAVMDRLIALPHGMILVTGPTGSGKTTTLYAALSKLYDPSLKVITVEDPVEYELAGVNQIPVNPERGLMFATGLRAILRQDPDVIMVGEIRDGETAEIAVRAALTGHLVLSTLHTNDAASAVGRLTDMEIEPFLLASTLEGILAQRLGRRLCAACARPTPIAEALQHRLLPQELALFKSGMGYTGAGCEACDGTGYRGRVGYYELLELTPPMRQAITAGRTTPTELLAHALPTHTTMRGDGLLKAAGAQTTVDEVLRATQDSEG